MFLNRLGPITFRTNPVLIPVVCLFAIIIYSISIRFGYHLFFDSKLFLFVLSLICMFNLVLIVLRFIYSFILVPYLCLFAMILYLVSVCLGFIYSLIVISGWFEFELL
jgi:hypothetical protein